MTESARLSAQTARRIALHAQGFSDPKPGGRVDRRHLRRVLGRVGLLQLDSVNVVARAHYVPVYARLGPYDVAALDDLAWGRRAELFEYWGHEASLLPHRLHPLLRWRMTRAREQGEAWGGLVRWARERPGHVAAVLAEVAARGPVRAGDLEPDGAGALRGTWWDRSEAKLALEWLFWVGDLAVARRVNFQRYYDLPERVLPAPVLATATPPQDDAQRRLLALAGRCLGVGTARDLADYFRIGIRDARPRLAELVEDGTLVPATVQGWSQQAYLHPGARRVRRVGATALLSPFDPLVWARSRAERLFGFRYRIEIYTPAPRRQWGYYVLPFLLDDALVARVDLKADRRAGTLRVLAAFGEDGRDPRAIAEPLAAELRRFGGWLGLEGITVTDRGDLAPLLRRAAASSVGIADLDAGHRHLPRPGRGEGGDH